MSDLTFTLRPARPGDLNALWPMVRRAVAKMNAEGSEQWGDDYPTRDIYAADIDRGELWAAVADDGAILGVAVLTDGDEPSYREVDWAVSGPALVIHRMAVDPSVQRGGVGAALFLPAEALARERGIPVIHIDTYSKNAAMQGLILSRGFLPRGEIHLHDRPLTYPCFEKVLT